MVPPLLHYYFLRQLYFSPSDDDKERQYSFGSIVGVSGERALKTIMSQRRIVVELVVEEKKGMQGDQGGEQSHNSCDAFVLEHATDSVQYKIGTATFTIPFHHWFYLPVQNGQVIPTISLRRFRAVGGPTMAAKIRQPPSTELFPRFHTTLVVIHCWCRTGRSQVRLRKPQFLVRPDSGCVTNISI